MAEPYAKWSEAELASFFSRWDKSLEQSATSHHGGVVGLAMTSPNLSMFAHPGREFDYVFPGTTQWARRHERSEKPYMIAAEAKSMRGPTDPDPHGPEAEPFFHVPRGAVRAEGDVTRKWQGGSLRLVRVLEGWMRGQESRSESERERVREDFEYVWKKATRIMHPRVARIWLESNNAALGGSPVVAVEQGLTTRVLQELENVLQGAL